QHIGDARLFLDQAFASSPTSAAPSVAVRPRRRGAIIAAAFLAGLVAASVPLWLYLRSRPQAAPPAMRFELVLPNYVAGPSISPDGRHVMYAGAAPGENVSVWIRDMGSESAEKLAGTEKPSGAVWSPDSRAIAVVSDGKLKRVDLTTRSVQVICDIG